MLKTESRASRATWVSTPPAVSSVSPSTKNTATAIRNDGTTVHSMPRMCSSVVTPPTRLGTRTVVSDSGDILSPM